MRPVLTQWLFDLEFADSKFVQFADDDDAVEFISLSAHRENILNKLCVRDIFSLEMHVDSAAMKFVGVEYARRNLILPIKILNNELYVATSDPFNANVIDDIQGQTNLIIVYLLAKKRDLVQFFDFFDKNDGNQVVDSLCGTIDFVKHASGPEVPIDRLFEHFFSNAVKLRASDIHFECNGDGMRVRFRIDGSLVTVQQIDQRLARAVVASVKLRASMKLDECRLPQDGRLKVVYDGSDYDVRVSILPNIYGENAVLRVFNRSGIDFSLANIGLSDAQLKCFRELSDVENGLILVSGPTGSGKTTTLYALLKHISSASKKVVTIEDPIEYKLPNVNQVAIDEKIGLTFNGVIRAVLRQAPNVIFVGEIRDEDTAQSAIQAALTGHLVLTSVHSGSSEEAITRLRDLGVSDYLINSCVRCIISQKLLRLRCTHCQNGQFCERCFDRGYYGRMGVFEILLNEDFGDAIIKSKFDNFGYLCRMEEEIAALMSRRILFADDINF